MTITKTKTEKPRLDLTALEWRLVLVTVLAISYVVAWYGIAGQAAPAVQTGTTLAPESAGAAPRPVFHAPAAPRQRIRTRSS